METTILGNEKMNTLGNDMSKETFDATLKKSETEKYHRQFANNESGFKELKKWLIVHEVEELHACMEATNVYWEDLAQYLHDEGYQVSVVNPARIKGFGQSQMQRSKTDKADSKVIAEFCWVCKPKLWSPPTPEQKKLRALARHLQTLKKTLIQQSNRLGTCKEPLVRASLEAIIETIKTQMAHIEQEIETFKKQDPELKEQHTLLTSITGIGDKTATYIMAEMYDLPNYDQARSAAADAGLTPSHYQSGTSVKRRSRLSKVGKASIRGVLFLPAITAIKHNPIVRDMAERLRKRGKCKMVIIGAAMRKLMHLAYGVLKNKVPFDPNYAR